jgi:osmoprotectant transport system substrate-binding protein
MRKIALLMAVVMVLGAFTAVGCAKEEKTIVVGSKEFTEQLILGYITKYALEDAGFKVVDDNIGMQGTVVVRTALVNGDIDIYWEYTGTALLLKEMLGHEEPITDPQECYETVKAEDLEKHGIVWLDYAPFNNTYVLMMRRADAEAQGIATISDLAEAINANPGADWSFATDAEFFARPDGYPALQALYGFEFPEGQVQKMDPGLTYAALKEGDVRVAMGFATDGRIKAFDFIALEDDKQFFPVYNPAPCVRQEVFEKYPELEDILAPVAAALTNEEMVALNCAVDVDQRSPEEVAKQWLIDQGLISGD